MAISELLLETSYRLLLETGDKILLESSDPELSTAILAAFEFDNEDAHE